MKFSILIIDSENVYDYMDNSADGIRYNDIDTEQLLNLLELSLKQNYSVVVQKDEIED